MTTDFGTTIEGNNNINVAATATAVADFVVAPRVNMDVTWPITDRNNLNLKAGIGYSAYLRHPELNARSPLITPGSALEFYTWIGNARLRFFGNLSYAEEPYGLPTVSDQALYRRFESAIGTQLDWDLNRVILTFLVQRNDLDVLTTELASQARTTDGLSFQLVYPFWQRLAFGTGAGFSATRYRQHIQNDSRNLFAGIFAHYDPTGNTSVFAKTGVQTLRYEPSGIVRGEQFHRAVFVEFAVNHRVNAHLRHRVAAQLVTEPGTGTNSYQLSTLDYRLAPVLFRFIDIEIGLSDERVTESDDSGRRFHRQGADLTLTKRLNRLCTLSAQFKTNERRSGTAAANYRQQIVRFTCTYAPQ